jgi:peroxin-6
MAIEAEPSIIFFDELDSLAPARGQAGDSGGVMDRVVSALLAELDGLERHNVTVIGATNRPDLLDSALLRPGRFERSIYMGTASRPEEQLGILAALTRRLDLAEDCDLREVVAALPSGLSGADLSGLVSTAALAAIRRQILLLESSSAGDDGGGTSQMQQITTSDFLNAASCIKKSVNSL